MDRLSGCQIPCLPHIAEGEAAFGPQALIPRLKRALARPWNYHVKRYLKQIIRFLRKIIYKPKPAHAFQTHLQDKAARPYLMVGDWVRVRSREEIQATLNTWKELKGCAFLEEMWQYCDTKQQVLQPLRRFLDERDYRVKKASGIILLKDVLCHGTPVFGQCDRCCHLFWREEWLERIQPAGSLD